jgi:hypothetical protein
MTRRLIRLIAFSLVAMAAIAPAVAQAHNGGHGRHHHGRALCGTLASVAGDQSSLVITTAHRGDVTVTNPNAVTVDTTLIGQAVCAKVMRQVAADGTKSLILVSLAAKPVHVKPYARAIAAGPVTVNGDGTLTVATLTFTVPSGFTLPTLNTGDIVAAVGFEASSSDTTFTLRRIWVKGAGGGHHHLAARFRMGRGWHHGGWFWGGPHAAVSGPVTAYTAATATMDGSITVANVMFDIPACTTLRHEPSDGDKVWVQGSVVNGVLTLTAGCGRHPH